MSLFRLKRGSVLVFSLIILSIILSAAITVATVSVRNQRSATSTGKSVQSFQVADSGVELALQKIYKGTYTSSDPLATAMTGMACSGTTLTKSDVAGGNVSLTLFDNDGNPINCSDTSWRDKVVKVKSEGSASGTTRVVETAVAPPELPCYGPQTWGMGYITYFISHYVKDVLGNDIDNSEGNGASQASLACGSSGPPSPAPGKLNVRFYMHNLFGCLTGFVSPPVVVTVPFSGSLNVWSCGSTTTYLEDVSCTATDCTIRALVRSSHPYYVSNYGGIFQEYESIVPRPWGL